jgi:hypothetical protein
VKFRNGLLGKEILLLLILSHMMLDFVVVENWFEEGGSPSPSAIPDALYPLTYLLTRLMLLLSLQMQGYLNMG